MFVPRNMSQRPEIPVEHRVLIPNDLQETATNDVGLVYHGLCKHYIYLYGSEGLDNDEFADGVM